MKIGIKDRVEGRLMKKLLLTCILIMSIIFIAGCIGEEKTDIGTTASSQISPEYEDQTPDLILKPSDVPGLTCDRYSFLAIPKNTPHEYGDRSESIEYEDILPIGYRNVGEHSSWMDQLGRRVTVSLHKLDSSPSEFIEAYTNNKDQFEKDREEYYLKLTETNGCDYDWGDPYIGDWSNYLGTTNQNTLIQEISLQFIHKNNWVEVSVIDEEGKSKKEAIRIAKIIKSRLD